MKRFSVMMVFAAWALSPSPGWSDEALGRLFYTPDQRARMDVARQHERSVKIDEEEEERTPQSANILLNGVITRSDGKSTLWINNRIQNEASPAATVGKGGEVRVVTPDAKRTVHLKVGQSIDLTSGQVEDVYRRSPSPGTQGNAQSPASMPSAAKRANTTEKPKDRVEPANAEPADVPSVATPVR